ncbi:MAG: prephenate dehydratase [Calditrichaeota bacterium]|nr:prephenate dehydratase [Calditrichota bacterium]
MNHNYEIAFQGEHYAFSEIAAKKFLEGDTICHPKPTFEDVFEAVKKGEPELGIIPIENTTSGSIHRNYDLLVEDGIQIVGEVNLRISLHLIAPRDVEFNQLQKIYSHPAALDQCRNFIRGNPQIEFIPSYDTAGSVKLIAERNLKNTGAIASKFAAQDYRMRILKEEIGDFQENYTRFLIISAKEIHFGEPNKTSIVFSTRHIPGALFKSISVFFLRDINLLKIESRPLRGKPWQYLFYLDFSGNLTDKNCQNAIEHLKEIAEFIKILGSYPAAK